MLLRARGGEPGALPWAGHGGGEVVAVWGSGVRGRDGEAPARGEKGGEELGRDAWVPQRAGGGLRPSTAAGGAAQRRRQSKQRSREVEDEGWTSL